MSTLKVNKLRDTAGSADAITLDPNGGAVLAGVTTISTARVTTGITSTSLQVGAAVTITESGIEASGIGITCASINGTQIGGRRNLIINGAMQVAQRGTSYTGADSYNTVDRISVQHSGLNEDVTSSQSAVASGTSPYAEGFRNAFKITNGNQSAGAGSSDYLYWWTILEAQDVANSGWNYTSASSFITISFWIKSSVAQNFYGFLQTADGTSQSLAYETGSLTADTWTKIVKTIPGNSNLQFDNDNGAGLYWAPARIFDGTSRTGSLTLDTWGAYNSSARTPDATSTFYTSDDATLEITGLQLEVGSQSTPFEHRSFGEELHLCQRYYEVLVSGSGKTWGGAAVMYIANQTHHQCTFVEKRSTPTLDYVSGSDYYRYYSNGTNKSSDTLDQFLYVTNKSAGIVANTLSGNLVSGGAAFSYTNNASAFVAISAEL